MLAFAQLHASFSQLGTSWVSAKALNHVLIEPLPKQSCWLASIAEESLVLVDYYLRDVPGSFDTWVENISDQSHVPCALAPSTSAFALFSIFFLVQCDSDPWRPGPVTWRQILGRYLETDILRQLLGNRARYEHLLRPCACFARRWAHHGVAHDRHARNACCAAVACASPSSHPFLLLLGVLKGVGRPWQLPAPRQPLSPAVQQPQDVRVRQPLQDEQRQRGPGGQATRRDIRPGVVAQHLDAAGAAEDYVRPADLHRVRQWLSAMKPFVGIDTKG